jgi:hypothetical protein
MTILKTLTVRLDALGGAVSPETRGVFDRAISYTDGIAAQKRDIEAPGTLSPKGVTQALRDHLSRGLVGEIERHRKAVVAEAEAISQARKNLGRPKIDPSDLVGELRRQEIRRWFRDLDPLKRTPAIVERDPTVFEAVITAPAYLSGMKQDRLEQAAGFYVAQKMPEQVAALDAREEANMIAGMAVEEAIKTLRKEAGVTASELSGWLDNPTVAPGVASE